MKRITTLEFILYSIIIGGTMFLADKFISHEMRQPRHQQILSFPAPVSTVTPLPKFVPLAEREKECRKNRECSAMAEALAFEARGESILGAAAVGYVILQRVKSPKWPNTIRGVVNFRCHFTFTCEKQSTSPSLKDWKRAYVVSYDVINGRIENPVKGADHYVAPKALTRWPRWTKVLTYVADVDNHRFYSSSKGVKL